MKIFTFAAYLTMLVLISSINSLCAYNPTLEDLCVADNDSRLENEAICKDPFLVTSDDFFSKGLDEPANIINKKLGSATTLIDETRLPALCSSRLSIARNDFAPYGYMPPHVHPRAGEVFTALQGAFYVGFITLKSRVDNSTCERVMYKKILSKGEVFFFPKGVVHFIYNIDNTPAFGFSAFSDCNPGEVVVGLEELYQCDLPMISDDF